MVMLVAFAVALASQATPPRPAAPTPLPPQTSCRMITPNGAVLAFEMSVRQQEGRQQVRLTPLSPIIWPSPNPNFINPTAFEGTGAAYVVGEGAHAVVLDIDPLFPDDDFFRVALREKRADQVGLTFAEGYCSDAPSAPLQLNPVANAGAFADAAAWPSPSLCWVLSRDGRKSAVRFRQEGQALTLEPLDRAIWNSGPMTVSIMRPPPIDRAGVRSIWDFAIRQAPDALPSLYSVIQYETEGDRATVSLRFDRLSSNAPVGEDAGFGICGIRGLRRAGS